MTNLENDIERLSVDENSGYLVNVQFTGPTLPRLFDAMRSCKGPGIICFTPHDLTVVGAEYRGDEDNPENLVSGMCFTLTKHEADSFHVSEHKVHRSASINMFHTILNVKAYRNKAKDHTTLSLIITKENPEKLVIIQRRKSAGGDAKHVLTLKEAFTNPFEYDHDYDPHCSRIVSSVELRDKCNALVTFSHKFCTIKITSNEIIFKGEGDGKKYANPSDCIMTMQVSGVPTTDEAAMSYTAQGTFEVSKLKTFTRLPALGEAHLYIENDKPLLLEYMLPCNRRETNYDELSDNSTPRRRRRKDLGVDDMSTYSGVGEEMKNCDACKNLNLSDVNGDGVDYVGFVRFVLEPKDL